MSQSTEDLARTKKLVQKMQRGDETAFSPLFDLYFRHVFYTSYQLLGDKEKAGDATNETFEKAYRNITKLEQPITFPKWITTICRNVCTDMLRKDGRDFSQEYYLALEQKERDLPEENREFLPEECLQDKELRSLIVDAVHRLPDAQREAVLLYYFDGLSGEEIAEITNSNSKAIFKRLSDARKTLRNSIAAVTETTTPAEERPIRQGAPMPSVAGAAAGSTVLSRVLSLDAKEVATSQVENAVRSSLSKQLGLPFLAKTGVEASGGLAGLIHSGAAKAVVAVLLTAGVAGGGALLYSSLKPETPVVQSAQPQTTNSAEETETSAPAVEVPANAEEATATPKKEESSAAQTSKKETTKKTKPVKEEPLALPTIILARSSVSYPANKVVSLKRVLNDAGVLAVDGTGTEIPVTVDLFDTVDFSTPGAYFISINAQDSRNQSADTAVLTIEIQP